MIVDAGGGTVDLSSYKFTTATPITVEEIAPTDCKYHSCYIVMIYSSIQTMRR